MSLITIPFALFLALGLFTGWQKIKNALSGNARTASYAGATAFFVTVAGLFVLATPLVFWTIPTGAFGIFVMAVYALYVGLAAYRVWGWISSLTNRGGNTGTGNGTGTK